MAHIVEGFVILRPLAQSAMKCQCNHIKVEAVDEGSTRNHQKRRTRKAVDAVRNVHVGIACALDSLMIHGAGRNAMEEWTYSADDVWINIFRFPSYYLNTVQLDKQDRVTSLLDAALILIDHCD